MPAIYQLIAISFSVLLLIGGITKIVTDYIHDTHDINKWEFIIVVAVLVPFCFLSIHLGWNIAKNTRQTFNRLSIGSEWQVFTETIVCQINGNCANHYSCNEHKCNCVTTCDSDGENCSTTCQTCSDDCPYCSHEINYGIKTIVDGNQVVNFYYARNRLPDNPEQNRWDAISESFEYGYWNPIPQNVLDRAGVGEPENWHDAKVRIGENTPLSVAIVTQYLNPLMASDNNVLELNYKNVQTYTDQNLLPGPDYQITGLYSVDLMRVVGTPAIDVNLWNRKLSQFNQACGNELKCEMRIVIVSDPIANENYEKYDRALQAYWMDPKAWGRDIMSPSTLLLVLHTTDGSLIDHAVAFTMVENRQLRSALAGDLVDQPLNPDLLLGNVRAQITSSGISYLHENPGVVESLVFGLSNDTTKFHFVDVNTQFAYLIPEIKPTTAQQIWIVIITVILGCSGWIIAYLRNEREFQGGNTFYKPSRYSS